MNFKGFSLVARVEIINFTHVFLPMYVFLSNSMLLLQTFKPLTLKRIVTGSLYIMWVFAIHHRGHFSLQTTFFLFSIFALFRLFDDLLLAFIIIWYSIKAAHAHYGMVSIAHAHCAVEAMLELHWIRAGIFWRRMFFSKIAYLYIVGSSPPCTIGAVIGSGNDELQCRPISAESAGGFRTDPEDRKRHLRRCVQGKTAARKAEVYYRTECCNAT